MNITLSADAELIAQARAYARARGTTLNKLLRDYMARLTGQLDPAAAADEFVRVARTHAGRSPGGFVFDREAIHDRGSRP